jgi:hypothetical protein
VAADRRAWTFEVRIAGEVTHDHLQAVLIPSQSLERALRWSDRVFIERRTAVHVEPLRFDVVADPDAIFRASGPLARRLCEAR